MLFFSDKCQIYTVYMLDIRKIYTVLTLDILEYKKNEGNSPNDLNSIVSV